MTKVSVFSNQVLIRNLSSPEVAGDFILAMKECIERGYSRPSLIISNLIPIYPNAACPIAGLIHYYKENGVNLKTSGLEKAAEAICIASPMRLDSKNYRSSTSALNKVWEFKSEEDVFRLTNAFVDELFKVDVFQQGALHSLEWSLYEIMDNVINHSSTDSGFIMGQIHPKSKHIAFCIFDAGQGIYSSLQTYQPKPITALDALTLCIKPGVTRGFGQGNGMFGLYEIIRQNEGQLTIVSSGASLTFKEGALETAKDLPVISNKVGCTVVDFQLNYAKPILLTEALKTNGKTYTQANHRMENLENDLGEIVFQLNDKSSGFGTRKAGAKMRNEVINIYKETGQMIVIDFGDIALVASSFADEFIGKLVLEFGFFGFNNIIRLRNMSELTQSIVQKSVSQRMAESIK